MYLTGTQKWVTEVGGVLPGWLGRSIAGAVILAGTAAILVGSTAILTATLTARFGALAMVVAWLFRRSVVIVTTLPRANEGRWGRHVGGVGVADSFRGGNGHPARNELSFGPNNVNRMLVDTI